MGVILSEASLDILLPYCNDLMMPLANVDTPGTHFILDRGG